MTHFALQIYGRTRLALLALCLASAVAPAWAGGGRHHTRAPQETGFLNRQIVLHGQTHRFQVYLPEQFRQDEGKPWPILLFLHGRGERGSEGMWQTQVGLPEALRDHPERWPFIVVLPQCPQNSFWTDPDNLTLAMATLDQEAAEFHADPDRTYLSGLSMGGYGAWELIRLHPKRWAAVAIAAGGVFWSYAPERWQHANTLPAEYARALGHTSAWLFHGSNDPIVQPRQDELLFEAIKAEGGRVRLWLFQGLKHDCWSRAFNEPDLPRWLLAHHQEPPPAPVKKGHEPPPPPKEPPPYAEHTLIPLHPAAIHLPPAQLEALMGEYVEPHGRGIALVYRQGEQIFLRDQYGQASEVDAESLSELFYPYGPSQSRILIERDQAGHVLGLTFRDDRRDERWDRRPVTPAPSASSGPGGSGLHLF